MNEKNTEALYVKFPQLYKQHLLTPEESSMHWRFQCDNGWFEIIYDISVQLQKITSIQPIEATEVKQKWGSLRYRVNMDSPEIDKLIKHAEDRARVTCEACGARSVTRYICARWRIVLCANCAKKGRDCVPEKS
jgi:hypothetical protein